MLFQSIESLVQCIDNIGFISVPSEELASHPHFTRKGRERERERKKDRLVYFTYLSLPSLGCYFNVTTQLFQRICLSFYTRGCHRQSNDCVFHKRPQSYSHPPFRSQQIIIKISVQGAKSNHYEISFALNTQC